MAGIRAPSGIPQSRLALGRGAAVSRGRGVPELCPHLAPQNHGVGLNMEVSQVQAQLRHAPAPGDHLPPAQRQPGQRRRQGPAHNRECLPCVR